MDPSPSTKPGPTPAPASSRPDGDRRGPSLWLRFRNRLISGLIFALPIAITFSIVYWLLMMMQRFVIDPLAMLTTRMQAYVRHYPALG